MGSGKWARSGAEIGEGGAGSRGKDPRWTQESHSAPGERDGGRPWRACICGLMGRGEGYWGGGVMIGRDQNLRFPQ